MVVAYSSNILETRILDTSNQTDQCDGIWMFVGAKYIYNMDIGYTLTCQYLIEYTDNESKLIQASKIHATLKPQDIKLRTSPFI